MKKKNIAKMLSLTPLVLPFVAFAQQVPVGPTVGGMFESVMLFLDRWAMPALVTLAALWFVWNVIRYFIGGKEANKDASKILYGLLGLFIILAFWGLIYLISSSLGIGIGGDGSSIVPYTPLPV